MLHKLDEPYMDNDYNFNTVHSLLNKLFQDFGESLIPAEHAGQDVPKAGQGETALFDLASSGQRVRRCLLIQAEFFFVFLFLCFIPTPARPRSQCRNYFL